MRYLSYLKAGIRDFKQNGGEIRDRIESMHGMPKITLGITGLSKNLGGMTGLKNPIAGDPLWWFSVDLKFLGHAGAPRA